MEWKGVHAFYDMPGHFFALVRLKNKVPQTRYHAKTKKRFFCFCIFGHHFWPSRFLPIFACRGGPGSAAPAAGRGPPRHAKIDFRLNLSRKYFGSENLTKTLRKPPENLPKTVPWCHIWNRKQNRNAHILTDKVLTHLYGRARMYLLWLLIVQT